MRAAFLIPVLLLVLAQRAVALDITTTDGDTYRHCDITQIEPDALDVMHAGGVARIPYEKLPQALQRRYFDADKVAAYRRVTAAREVEEQRQRQQAAFQAEQDTRHRAEEQKRQYEERQRREVIKRVQAQEEARDRLAAEQQQKTIHELGAVIIVTVIGIASLLIYFLPAIIGRHKTNAGAIFVLNFLAGWSFVGWVIALVWACTKDSAMDTLARDQMSMRRDDSRFLE